MCKHHSLIQCITSCKGIGLRQSLLAHKHSTSPRIDNDPTLIVLVWAANNCNGLLSCHCYLWLNIPSRYTRCSLLGEWHLINWSVAPVTNSCLAASAYRFTNNAKINSKPSILVYFHQINVRKFVDVLICHIFTVLQPD